MRLHRSENGLLEQEHFFVLSDAALPTLQKARHEMMKWQWSRILYKAKGNAVKAGQLLSVTKTYIRKFRKTIGAGIHRKERNPQGGDGASWNA